MNESTFKHIAITGASSEIGVAIAHALAGSAVRMTLQCHTHADRLKDLLPTFRCTTHINTIDLSDTVQCLDFAKSVEDAEILVNAAAVTITDLLANLSELDISKMLSVNISSLITICQRVLPAMMRRRSGNIINLSSITASRAHRGQSVYAGTKGFVESFSRVLAAEGAPRSVRVNCVAPGAIEAGSLRPLLTDASAEIKSGVALNRLGSPQDVANAVAFLCDAKSSFITGQVISVNGGSLRGLA